MNQGFGVMWLQLRFTFTARPAFPASPVNWHRLTGVNAQREWEAEAALRGTGRRPLTSPSAALLNSTTNLNRSRQTEPCRRRESQVLLKSLSGSLRGHRCDVMVAPLNINGMLLEKQQCGIQTNCWRRSRTLWWGLALEEPVQQQSLLCKITLTDISPE